MANYVYFFTAFGGHVEQEQSINKTQIFTIVKNSTSHMKNMYGFYWFLKKIHANIFFFENEFSPSIDQHWVRLSTAPAKLRRGGEDTHSLWPPHVIPLHK